jgi:hypothetical protein
MAISPLTVRLTRALLLFNSILWFAFSVYTALDRHPSYRGETLLRWGAVVLAFLAGAALVAFAYLLVRHSRPAYWLSVGFLVAIAVATLFDQFGLPDFAFLVVTVLPLSLLLKDRPWYLQPPARSAQPAV